MKVETQLAGASMTNVELRDPQKIYHRLDLGGLKKLAPDVAWDGYLAKIGFPDITAINVAQPDFVKELDAMTKSVKIARLAHVPALAPRARDVALAVARRSSTSGSSSGRS